MGYSSRNTVIRSWRAPGPFIISKRPNHSLCSSPRAFARTGAGQPAQSHQLSLLHLLLFPVKLLLGLGEALLQGCDHLHCHVHLPAQGPLPSLHLLLLLGELHKSCPHLQQLRCLLGQLLGFQKMGEKTGWHAEQRLLYQIFEYH